jgi:hypothetical protein
MWKSLSPGDKVRTGDSIRYLSGAASLTPFQDMIFDVVKTDLHYFEIVVREAIKGSGEPERKIVKYTDIGYHISLEIWTDKTTNLADCRTISP